VTSSVHRRILSQLEPCADVIVSAVARPAHGSTPNIHGFWMSNKKSTVVVSCKFICKLVNILLGLTFENPNSNFHNTFPNDFLRYFLKFNAKPSVKILF